MAEPGIKSGSKPVTIRVKTPQEIERQSARAQMTNYSTAYRNGKRIEDEDINQRLRRSVVISKATENARKRAGYESTGVRTRNMDQIFRNTSNGQYFTVQGDRIVNYRGKKLNRY